MNFPIQADNRVTLKKGEKRDKYLNIWRELKKTWNMNVTLIPVVIDLLGTVTNGLIQGFEDLEI